MGGIRIAVRPLSALNRVPLNIMAKKPRKKKKKVDRRPQTGRVKKGAKYSPGEIAMAVLGAAILVMVAGIIITALLG